MTQRGSPHSGQCIHISCSLWPGPRHCITHRPCFPFCEVPRNTNSLEKAAVTGVGGAGGWELGWKECGWECTCQDSQLPSRLSWVRAFWVPLPLGTVSTSQSLPSVPGGSCHQQALRFHLAHLWGALEACLGLGLGVMGWPDSLVLGCCVLMESGRGLACAQKSMFTAFLPGFLPGYRWWQFPSTSVAGAANDFHRGPSSP